jgi:hypothetical protein
VRSLMSAAGVQPEQRDAQPGSSEIRALTGAQAPSGVPIVQARATSADRGDRYRTGGKPRFEGAHRDGRPERRPARPGNRSVPARGAARRGQSR